MTASSTLPAGYRHEPLGDIDSTNTEAFRRSDAGAPDRLWLTADRQTIGRGRGDRNWTSEPGNLYATLLLHLNVPLATALQLPFVAGVAVHDAITDTLTDACDCRLSLKWPNDVLLDGQKVCGILVESRAITGTETLAVAAGFGINVAHHPPDTRTPATHLHTYDAGVTAEVLFASLALRLAHWLDLWDLGAGFARIRESWQARAVPIGHAMRVNDGSSVTKGTYAGLDVDGALLLNVSGSTQRILFGDVMFPAHDSVIPPQNE